MTPTHEATLKRICEKTGNNPYAWRIDNPYHAFALRGFLTDPKTLKAVFGEDIDHRFVNDACIVCGEKTSEWGGDVCSVGWLFHAIEISKMDDADAILYYYAEHMKEDHE